MSSNKFNYYTVTRTSVVKATSKTDALAIAMNRRGFNGENLATDTEIERIPAAEAHTLVQTVWPTMEGRGGLSSPPFLYNGVLMKLIAQIVVRNEADRFFTQVLDNLKEFVDLIVVTDDYS